jgi:hypothetical protein
MVTTRKLELLTSLVSTRKPYTTSLFAGRLGVGNLLNACGRHNLMKNYLSVHRWE